VIIDSKVYDVTSVLKWHPGGHKTLEHMGGKNATDAFAGFHPAKVYRTMLPNYYIGDVADLKESEITLGFRRIQQRLLEEGVFETRWSYYVQLVAWLAFLFASAIALAVTSERFAGQHIFAGFVMGFFWQQCAFLGHDVGHNGVSHVRAKDLASGLVIGNLLTGVGVNWWKHSHNVHHVMCNSVEHDPDIQHMPIFAVTPKIFRDQFGFFSSYQERDITFDAAARVLLPYQHWLYYPVMALARFNLYVQSWIRLFSKDKMPYRYHEMVANVLFLAWYITLVATMPGASTATKLGFTLMSHVVAGLLHVQICLSHFAMETYHGHAMKVVDGDDDWYRMQLRTTQDIVCHPLVDWFHGGLQFQIEHHLFPRVPRHNLRYVRSIVKAFCEEQGVVYNEQTWIEAQVQMISRMKETAVLAEKLGAGAIDISSQPIVEGFFAEG